MITALRRKRSGDDETMMIACGASCEDKVAAMGKQIMKNICLATATLALHFFEYMK
jgi:ABC-type antimicrobial peptide transport system ATPase subunit